MDAELIAAILALLNKPKDEVLPELDKQAADNPLLAGRILAFRNFIAECYAALPGNAVAGAVEVFHLFATGSGPSDPDIGDTF